MERRPTLRSVATRAGVSPQTVSNVLNAPDLVRPETRERVRAAIDEVGYRPHRAAQQLRTRRSHLVGVRVLGSLDGVRGAVTERFLHAVTEHAQELGYRITVFAASDDVGEIREYEELLDTLEVDAFVLTDTHHADARTRWLGERGVPFVTFGRPWDGRASRTRPHAWVDVDGAAGTRAAVEHLAALGHRRIAFLGWPHGSEVGDDRRRGWREAMEALHLTSDELDALDTLNEDVEDTVDNGAEAAATLVERAAPTAFVCSSDSLALGVLAATRSGADLTAPSPCAVVGFDDTPVAHAVGLSSVAQPLRKVARLALRLLVDQLGQPDGDETGEPHERQVLLRPNLVIRASSSTPPPSEPDV